MPREPTNQQVCTPRKKRALQVSIPFPSPSPRTPSTPRKAAGVRTASGSGSSTQGHVPPSPSQWLRLTRIVDSMSLPSVPIPFRPHHSTGCAMCAPSSAPSLTSWLPAHIPAPVFGGTHDLMSYPTIKFGKSPLDRSSIAIDVTVPSVSSYYSIDDLRAHKNDHGALHMPNSSDLVREIMHDEQTTGTHPGYIKLRVMWPGYSIAEDEIIIQTQGMTRVALACNIAQRVAIFIMSIRSGDNENKRTSCTLREHTRSGREEYSKFDIFHAEIMPEDVRLVSIVNTHGDCWQPILHLVEKNKEHR